MELNLNTYLLRQVYLNKEYAFFDGSKPYNLNILGIRSMVTESNEFNDLICCAYRNSQNEWTLKQWPGTTDPGSYWLNDPMNVNGTAILVPGQYRGAWSLGLHRGRYVALIQEKAVSVYRDNNLDEVIDMEPDSIDVGVFGINIHRASETHGSQIVDKWSAGCQVFSNPNDFLEFITLCERQKDRIGDRFTYTLFEEIDFMGGE